MGFLFGGSAKRTTSQQSPTVFNALRVQTSVYGRAIPLVYGQNRVSGNLVWYGDFRAIAHVEHSGGGGGKGLGGGGGGASTTTYTYSASVQLGLCEGPIEGVGVVWQDKNRTSTAGLGFTFMPGSDPQSPVPELATNHPDAAFGYNRVANLYRSNYDLGDNPDLPNHNFEIFGFHRFNPGAGVVDANPADIIIDFLTEPHHGVGFPVENLADLSVYRVYCQATGLLLSPVFDEQNPAHDTLTDLLAATNSGAFWSGKTVKIVPYGDQTVSGNGATYVPDLTPLYDLTDADFIVDPSQPTDPVTVKRTTPADAFNQVQIEYVDRTQDYNVAVTDSKDDAHINLFGLRPSDIKKHHEICDATTARTVAYLIMQRQLYVRNTYTFTLGWRFCVLEPMDLITITDANLGLIRTLVRVMSVDEDDQGQIAIEAEEMLIGAASTARFNTESGSGFSPNYSIDPGDVSPPVIFDGPVALAESGLEVWCAVSGGPNWGGADVWLSTDNATYSLIGTIKAPARMGTLAFSLPQAPPPSDTDSSVPDTTSVLSVDISESRGQLFSVTAADAKLGHALCYVDGELVSFQTANLVGSGRYDLSVLYRGLFGSKAEPHAQGSAFARLDGSIFKFAYTKDQIGQTIYVKFTSFNIYGSAQQSLAEVTTYSHVVGGPTPPSGLQAVPATWDVAGSVELSWTPPSNQYATGAFQYQVEYLPPGATAFTVAGRTTGTSFIVRDLSVGTYVFRVKLINARDISSDYISIETVVVPPGIPNVTGLELFNAANGTNFYGRDAKFTWRDVSIARSPGRGNLSSPTGTDGARDFHFKDYLVSIEDASGKTLRSENTLDPFYIYSYEKNVEDGGPRRSFTITVYARGQQNQLSPQAARLTVNNPPPAVPAALSVSGGIGLLFVSFAQPSETDWAGSIVWASTGSGFDPAVTPPAARAYQNQFSLDVTQGQTYYVRVANFDSFGDEPATLNISTELAVTVAAIEPETKFTVTGINFTPNAPGANQVSWTAGSVSYGPIGSTPISDNIPSGSATFTSGVLYIYYARGTGHLQTTDSLAVAFANPGIVLATYYGATDLSVGTGASVQPETGFTFEGLTFTPNVPGANQVSWTSGAAFFGSIGGPQTTDPIPAGNATFTSGVLYVYYAKGSGSLQTTSDLATAFMQPGAVLATYQGGTNLTIGNGNSYIDGGRIIAQTIGANQLVANQAVITGSAQIANATINDAHITTLSGTKILAQTIGSNQLVTNQAVITGAAQIASAIIDDSKITNLRVDKLTGGTIGAQQVFLGDQTFLLDGSTQRLTVKDANSTPRVQLGGLGGGGVNYGIKVNDQSGNLILSSSGLGASTVGASQIVPGAVGTTQIASAAIGSAQIQDLSVGTLKITNGAITDTTAMYASGAVSYPSNNGASLIDALTVSLNVISSNAVYVFFLGRVSPAISTTSQGCGEGCTVTNQMIDNYRVQIVRDNGQASQAVLVDMTNLSAIGALPIGITDTPGPGVHSYSLLIGGYTISGGSIFQRSMFVMGFKK